jgi:hypothetical protein
MAKLLALALVPGLLLFGCAATQTPAPKEQVQAQAGACQTTTPAAMRERFQQNGIKLKADLEGEPLDALKEFLSPHVDKPIPAEVDRALIFEREGVALIVWFANDCAVGHAVGPWDAIKGFMGTPI